MHGELDSEELGMKIGKNSWISPKASVYGGDTIIIGENVRIDDFCILSGGEGGLNIGSHIHIGAGVKLFGGGGLILEDFVQISSNSIVYSQSDDMSGNSLVGPCIPMEFKPGLQSGLTSLLRHVFLGANTIVLPGVTIGAGVSAAAFSLINKDCFSWKKYKGIPARIYGNRSQEILLLEEQFLREYRSRDND